MAVTANKLVEVTRSFSRKLQLGNYESIDIFCSYKTECTPEEAAQASESAYAFCRREVMRGVKEQRKKMARIEE